MMTRRPYRPLFRRRAPRRAKEPRPVRKGRLLVFVLLLLTALLFIFINLRLLPLMASVASARVSNLVTRTIEASISREIAAGRIDCASLISFEKDDEGKVTAVRSDMGQVNRLRAELLTVLITDLNDLREQEFGIPVGTLTGNGMLSGRGPSIPVRILSVAAADSSFENTFTSAGINQTVHRIVLHIGVDVGVLLPGYTTSTRVESTINVAETVIVGDVPQSYTYFSQFDTARDAADEFNDYGPGKNDYLGTHYTDAD